MNGIPRERDPNLVKLENDVFGKMTQKLRESLPLEVQDQPKKSDTTHVSFEDALRELSSLDSLEPTEDKS